MAVELAQRGKRIEHKDKEVLSEFVGMVVEGVYIRESSKGLPSVTVRFSDGSYLTTMPGYVSKMMLFGKCEGEGFELFVKEDKR